MKINKIVGLFDVLSKASLSKLEDADKYIVIKMLRKLRPISEKFEADKKDAYERLRPENWAEIADKSNQWREENNSQELTDDEKRYIIRVNECLADELNREEDVDLPKLSEEAFGKLMSCNEWNNLLALELSEMLVVDDVSE